MPRVLNKKHWPYTVKLRHKNIDFSSEAVDYCREMFPGHDRVCYVMAAIGFIHFRDEADATLCQLKWA